MGLFKAYRYNQLLAAIINIILDFLLVKRIGIVGVFLATTIANLLFAVFPFIKNLYIEGFEKTQESVKALNKNAGGYIRRELGARMKLRKVPELRFIADNSIENSAQISKIIDSFDKSSQDES